MHYSQNKIETIMQAVSKDFSLACSEPTFVRYDARNNSFAVSFFLDEGENYAIVEHGEECDEHSLEGGIVAGYNGAIAVVAFGDGSYTTMK